MIYLVQGRIFQYDYPVLWFAGATRNKSSAEILCATLNVWVEDNGLDWYFPHRRYNPHRILSCPLDKNFVLGDYTQYSVVSAQDLDNQVQSSIMETKQERWSS